MRSMERVAIRALSIQHASLGVSHNERGAQDNGRGRSRRCFRKPARTSDFAHRSNSPSRYRFQDWAADVVAFVLDRNVLVTGQSRLTSIQDVRRADVIECLAAIA